MAIITPTLAQMGQRAGDHMGRWGNGRGWMLLVALLFGLVLVGLMVWGIIAITRSNKAKAAAPPPGSSPLDILAQRYARGEIDTADFEERKRALM